MVIWYRGNGGGAATVGGVATGVAVGTTTRVVVVNGVRTVITSRAGQAAVGTAVGGTIGTQIPVERISENVETEVGVERNVVTGSPSDVNCGDKGPYKNQKRPYRDPDNKLERDHIPSKALVHDYADRALGAGGLESLLDCVKKEITKNMDTLALPIDIHKEKTKRTRPNSMSDETRLSKSDDLSNTAREEADIVEEEVDEAMDDDDPCKDRIKEKLEEFRNLGEDYFDELIENAVDFCN